MGIPDLFSDLYTSLFFTELHAEAPEQIEEESDQPEGEESKAEIEDGGEDKEEEGGEDAAEEEEEEEEEPEDIKPKLEEGMLNELPLYPLSILHCYNLSSMSLLFLFLLSYSLSKHSTFIRFPFLSYSY